LLIIHLFLFFRLRFGSKTAVWRRENDHRSLSNPIRWANNFYSYWNFSIYLFWPHFMHYNLSVIVIKISKYISFSKIINVSHFCLKTTYFGFVFIFIQKNDDLKNENLCFIEFNSNSHTTFLQIDLSKDILMSSNNFHQVCKK
jgi:hypothetical protein